ncbi:MAG TPA: carbonic anhydrase [Pseudogracilibacillus sp.]|nr:carbonic anhydrase [Pseudogracilibacillus sp.]
MRKTIQDMLKFNEQFVEDKNYEPFVTDSIPNKKLVIFTCMESRLLELLPKALNIQNGDAKMLKNAGAIIRKDYDSIVKSILVAVYDLKAEEVAVIGHHDCGMSHVDTTSLKSKMLDQDGITEKTFEQMEASGVHFDDEFHGFDTVEESVQQSVDIIRNHPLLPSYVAVHGLVIDPGTGKVDVVSLDEKTDIEG